MSARLLHGDCLDLLPSIESGSVGLVLADLPYGTTQNKWDSVIDLDRLWPELWRVLRPNGAAVLTSQGVFTAQLIMSQARHFKYKWVWQKTQSTGFLNAKKQPLRIHEDVCVFYREQCTYNPQMAPGAPWSCRAGMRTPTSYGTYAAIGTKSEGGRYPVDVMTFANASRETTVQSTFHATQKPVKLGRYMVRTYSDPGDVVLDMTCGSGSFLVAAVCERRGAIGIELSAGDVDTARARLRLAVPGLDVEGGDPASDAASQGLLFG